jgi:lipoyl(octanoyl) transferase
VSALHVLPPRGDSATANIAADFLLLQRYPVPAVARFRHYEWQRPAFTFGFSQKIEFIRAAVESAQPVELCRRPTGGGLVDHRDDCSTTCGRWRVTVSCTKRWRKHCRQAERRRR